MAGVGRVVLRAGVAAILVVLLLPGARPPVFAASGERLLTRHALSNVAADLDGDGEREVVAIVAEPESGAPLRVAAWGFIDDEWLSLGEEPVQHWNATEERATMATAGTSSAGLLALRDGDRTRVIVVSAIPYGTDTNPGACCLSVSEVSLPAAALSVELMPDDLGSVESLTPMDLEGDGRDELLVSAYAGDERDPYEPAYAVLRQAGNGFVATPIPSPDGEQMYLNTIGDSDGVVGDDLLFMSTDNRALVRVSADGDDVALERVSASSIIDVNIGGGIAGAANGVILISSDRQIETARWPRGGQIELIASEPRDTWPYLYLTGDGSGARIIEVTGWDGPPGEPISLKVLDLDLSVEAEVDASPATADLRDLAQSEAWQNQQIINPWPQMGPIPGGLADGRPAFLGLGSLVALDPTGVPTVNDAATVLGGEVLGVVGPASEWIAIGSGWFGGGGWAYLGHDGFEPDGMPEMRLAVAPLDAILTAPTEAGFSLQGATVVEEPDGPMVYAGEGGFDAVVSGVRGTVVVTAVNHATNTTEIEDGPVTVTLDPPGRTGSDRRHDASMLVVSPAGIARVTSWDLTTLPEAPEVSPETSFELLEAHATVFGDVAPMMTVTVDGRPVAMSGEGSFRADVDASIWPREVEVVVRDPIGQETVRIVEVVGIVDVRALPWIPIMAVLTVAAGILLFLRTPVVRPQERVVMDGDGHLEEIDGDLA